MEEKTGKPKPRPQYRRRRLEPLTEEEKVGLARLKPKIVEKAAKAEEAMKEAIWDHYYAQNKLELLEAIERDGGLHVPLESPEAFLFIDIQQASTPDRTPPLSRRDCSSAAKRQPRATLLRLNIWAR
jgi:hypothetical protein